MSSFCIKTNNDLFVDYFLNNYSSSLSDFKKDIHVKKRYYKIYKNLVINYKTCNITTFYEKLSRFITEGIVNIYEKRIISKIVFSSYFYFLDNEQLNIINNTTNLLKEDKTETRKELIYLAVLNYIESKENSMILEGFITFRLKDYIDILDYAVELEVNNFLVKREYLEFVKLLKKYISSNESTCNRINLLHLNGSTLLLDENYNLINTYSTNIDELGKNMDITFSSNDYSLNTLLNLLPKKIDIHLLDKQDEFIDTIKLIFR